MNPFRDMTKPQRWVVGATTAALISGGTFALAQTPATNPEPHIETARSLISQADAELALALSGPPTSTVLPTTTTRPGPTTTTQPGPTTTTRVPPTTTTRPPSVTTTTGTTVPPPTVLPPTIPIVGEGSEFDGFIIMLLSQDVSCDNPSLPGCTPIPLWDAKYQWQVPYTADDAGWLGGEREAYSCAYMFLEHEGELIGRITFAAVKPPRTAVGFYGIMIDKFMPEGVRFFDGSPTPLGTIHTEPGECPGTTVPYTTAVGADQRPRIGFLHNGEVIEVRDYLPTQVAPGTIFNVVEVITEPFTVTVPSGTSTVNERVTVLALLNGTPQIAVYYDAIGSGTLVTEMP